MTIMPSFQTIELTTQSGQRIIGIQGDWITRRIQSDGIYEPVLYHFLTQLLPGIHDCVCLDIGANIGNHVITLGKHAQTVHAFEPVPMIFDLLSKNVALNELNNVTLHPIGLGTCDETVSIGINDKQNIGASSIVHISEGQEVQSIHLRKGDDVIAELNLSRLDLIKIDVEGFETPVVKGLKETIRRFRPIVVLEWNCDSTRAGFRQDNLFAEVFSGYQILPLTTNHDDFGRLTRTMPYLPFRGLVRSFYRRLVAERIMIGRYLENSDYNNLILAPTEQLGRIQDAVSAIRNRLCESANT
jgi:FkbM family methyltransferase